MHGCSRTQVTCSGRHSARALMRRTGLTRSAGLAAAMFATAMLTPQSAWSQVRSPGLEDDGVVRPADAPLPTPAARPQPDPVRPNAPTPPANDIETSGFIGGGLLSEGTFLAGAKGRPVRGKTGSWYIVFDADQRGPAGQPIPAMVLMPNLHLASIERLSSRLQDGQRIAISGQVFVYAGVNFLFASTPPIVEQTASAPTPAPASATATPSPASNTASNTASDAAKPTTDAPAADSSATPTNQTTPSPAPNEPSVEQIIEQLDKAVGASKRVDLPKISGAELDAGAEGNGTPPALVPGGYLASRTGRIVRGNDGAPTFVFDSGASGQREGPMILLPCLNLMRMENIAAVQGDKAKVTVSGDVVVYRNKNYLLPRMFVVNRRTDIVVSGQ